MSADTAQIILDSGDIIELEATIPALFEINKYPNGLTISMKGGSFITARSLNSKELFVAPPQYGSGKVCNTGTSQVLLSVPASETVADVSIFISKNVCGATPTPTPSPSATPSPSLSPGISPAATSVTPSNNGAQMGGGLMSPSVSPELPQNTTGPQVPNTGILANLVDDSSTLSGILATLGTAATISTLLGVALAHFGQIFQSFETFKFWLFWILGLKRKRPWGVAWNKYLKVPVPRVNVQVFDAEYKKLRDTQLTDEEGRFLFLLEKGDYILRFSKDGYETFESQATRVDDPNAPTLLDIQLSPLKVYVGDVLDIRQRLRNLRDVLTALNPYILLIGTVLSAYNITIDPSFYNKAVLGAYIIFDIFQLYFLIHTVRSFGRVIDRQSREYIQLALIRLFDHKSQVLLSTKASDKDGRYTALLPPGTYYLSVVKPGLTPFVSDPIVVAKNQVLNFDVALNRQSDNDAS